MHYRHKKDQEELENYIRANHSKERIGQYYERYIGYLFEKEGYRVQYHGIKKGFEDMGRDLVARRSKETIVIQCKNWSREGLVHEKHIHQLFGSASHFQLENFERKKEKNRVQSLFITTTQLSAEAFRAAQLLGVETKIIPLQKYYPIVKCNINSKIGKHYLLPWDKAYDSVEICEAQGECFAYSVEEAVEMGFESIYIKKKAA